MMLHEKVAVLYWAFPRGDYRRDDIRKLAEEVRRCEARAREVSMLYIEEIAADILDDLVANDEPVGMTPTEAEICEMEVALSRPLTQDELDYFHSFWSVIYDRHQPKYKPDHDIGTLLNTFYSAHVLLEATNTEMRAAHRLKEWLHHKKEKEEE